MTPSRLLLGLGLTFQCIFNSGNKVAAWQSTCHHLTPATTTTTTTTRTISSSTALSHSRRTFLLQVPTTITTTAAILTALPPPSAAATAPPITSEAARLQWKQSLTVIDDLVQNWSTVTSKGGGDSIRIQLGTVGTASPLFLIDKALKVLREEADDLVEFTEQEEEFRLALSRADSMAYSANFAGGSGKPTPPQVYIDKSQKEVIGLQKIAKSLSALL
mmetsp:Transcript_19055/g.22758  ORF Transcript_19055/g.22758 Transcript_19055/m.22758 type:complete len:218 (-) Transcript_19055:114-767(-)